MSQEKFVIEEILYESITYIGQLIVYYTGSF